mmetsp:Transcript_2867/g.10310  ORF Transcript_2867/g.10310 Transcript_2867/m.10310 type:complete len:211 (-) Transcript_2867:110-742(-)
MRSTAASLRKSAASPDLSSRTFEAHVRRAGPAAAAAMCPAHFFRRRRTFRRFQTNRPHARHALMQVACRRRRLKRCKATSRRRSSAARRCRASPSIFKTATPKCNLRQPLPRSTREHSWKRRAARWTSSRRRLRSWTAQRQRERAFAADRLRKCRRMRPRTCSRRRPSAPPCLAASTAVAHVVHAGPTRPARIRPAARTINERRKMRSAT